MSRLPQGLALFSLPWRSAVPCDFNVSRQITPAPVEEPAWWQREPVYRREGSNTTQALCLKFFCNHTSLCLGLLLSLNKYLESLQGSSQIHVSRVFKITNRTFDSNSAESQVVSHKAPKDGQEGLAWDVMKLFPMKPRERGPCKVTCKAHARKRLAELSHGQCLSQ